MRERHALAVAEKGMALVYLLVHDEVRQKTSLSTRLDVDHVTTGAY